MNTFTKLVVLPLIGGGIIAGATSVVATPTEAAPPSVSDSSFAADVGLVREVLLVEVTVWLDRVEVAQDGVEVFPQ